MFLSKQLFFDKMIRVKSGVLNVLERNCNKWF